MRWRKASPTQKAGHHPCPAFCLLSTALIDASDGLVEKDFREETSGRHIVFTQHSQGFYAREQDRAPFLAHQLSPAVAPHSTVAAASAVQRGAPRLPEALEQLLQKLTTDIVDTDADTERIIDTCAQDHGQSPAN